MGGVGRTRDGEDTEVVDLRDQEGKEVMEA